MYLKRRIAKSVYNFILKIHAKRVERAKGWRKVYLTYLTPPSFAEGCKKIENWFHFNDFLKVLETQHKDRLRFPLAKWFYLLDYIFSAVLFGACNENYFRFNYCGNRSWRYRTKNITSRRLSFIVAHLNSLEGRELLNDKVKFAEHWDRFFNRAYFSIADTECYREAFCERFRNCKKLIVKPLAGLRGQGIRIIDVKDNLSEIYDDLRADTEKKIVEEYIEQTGLLHTFNPSSLNTVRVITLRDGENVHLLSATLRVGGKDAVIDNLHAGGVGFTVSPENGMIHSGISMNGTGGTAHPDTGMEIAGRQIPNWDAVKEFCIEAHKIAPNNLEYIGWDVCVCEDRLYMIEGNGWPGVAPCLEGQDLWGTICRFFDMHPEMKLKPRK